MVFKGNFTFTPELHSICFNLAVKAEEELLGEIIFCVNKEEKIMQVSPVNTLFFGSSDSMEQL